MIRHFDPTDVFEPEVKGRFQLGPALGAGLIAGIALLVVPCGSPWSGLTLFSAVIMGRALPQGLGMPLATVWLVHLVLAELYGLIISLCLRNFTQGKAIIAGAFIGAVLYLANLAVVSLLWPAWRSNEAGVLLTHVVFGLIAAGAYQGLFSRKQALGAKCEVSPP